MSRQVRQPSRAVVRLAWAAAALLVWVGVSGCTSSASSAGPRVRVVELIGPNVTAASYRPDETAMLRVEVRNYAAEAIRLVHFEGTVMRGRSTLGMVRWVGTDNFVAGGIRAYQVPMRAVPVSAARAALDASAPVRLTKLRIIYDDARGIRRTISPGDAL